MERISFHNKLEIALYVSFVDSESKCNMDTINLQAKHFFIKIFFTKQMLYKIILVHIMPFSPYYAISQSIEVIQF